MLKITRGRIYHNIMGEISDLFCSLFGKLDDKSKVQEFEEKFAQRIGTKYAKAYPFARYALYTILKYQNFPKGSEIIMPPITIKPMVDIILMLGHKPIFIDVELDTLCFDPEQLQKSITPNTKAILITYLFGIVPDVEKILSIAKEHNILTIEDFSHTLNAQYKGKTIGSLADVSFFSSSSMKTVDTYIGGTIFTNDEEFYKYLEQQEESLPNMPRVFLFKKVLLNFIRNLFSKKIIFTFITNPLLNIIKSFNPTLHKKILGARLNLKPVEKMPEDWSYRFTSLQAKRGLVQLQQVDQSDSLRISNVHNLRNSVDKHVSLFPKELETSKNVYWQYPLYVENPEKFIQYMNEHNIDLGLTNLSLCSYLDIYPEYMKETLNAFTIKNNYIFIPMYAGLSTKDINYIISTVKNYIEENK